MIKNTILFKSSKEYEVGTNGFTLIELIISIVVLGFVLFSLIKLFADVSVISTHTDYRYVQHQLAHELLEEIKSQRFDELINKDGSGNWSGALGINAGETASDKSTFDDVDDFNGWSETMSAPFTGFTRSVTVSYVAGNDLNTALTIPAPITADWTPNYKKITVTVGNSSVNSFQLSTIVSTAKSRDKAY